jgi:16S rRNA (uracil1498-N3)-methyltransferase
MRLHRFYVQQPLGEVVHIDDKELVHQWSSVFRYTSGDVVLLFSLSSPSYDYEYQISEISKSSAVLTYVKKTANVMPKKVTSLYMALVKKDTFETIARQATEMMITDIIPVVASRSEKKNINIERLLSVVTEAAEQCGRGDIPRLHEIMTFADAVREVTITHVVFDKDGDHEDGDLMSAAWVGPEGGWTMAELSILQEKGARTLSLGASILKADTAAVVGMAKAFIL